jgi:hypothetical protein
MSAGEVPPGRASQILPSVARLQSSSPKRNGEPPAPQPTRVSRGQRGSGRLANVPPERAQTAEVAGRLRSRHPQISLYQRDRDVNSGGGGIRTLGRPKADNGFRARSVQPGKPGVAPSWKSGGTSGGTKTGRCPCKHPCDSSWPPVARVDLSRTPDVAQRLSQPRERSSAAQR